MGQNKTFPLILSGFKLLVINLPWDLQAGEGVDLPLQSVSTPKMSRAMFSTRYGKDAGLNSVNDVYIKVARSHGLG